jgi:hypothetical protein
MFLLFVTRPVGAGYNLIALSGHREKLFHVVRMITQNRQLQI